MRAAVFHSPGVVRVEDVPLPELRGNGALVRVRTATICATDVKTWRRGHPYIAPPVILGHEWAGVVTEVAGLPSVSPGDVVTVAPYVECGRCFLCRHGAPELCESKVLPSNGAFAEFIHVPPALARRGMVKIPPGIPADVGTFAEPLACVLNGLSEIDVRGAEVAAVIGAGPMGLLFALALQDREAQVVVSEPLPERRSLAAALGVDAVAPVDVQVRVMESTAGRGADAVIVAVGDPEVAAESLGLPRKGGRVLWFGGFPPGARAAMDPNVVHYRQVAVHGSFGFSSRQFRHAAYTLARGLDPTPLITHRFPLSQIEAALEMAASQRAGKVAVVPE